MANHASALKAHRQSLHRTAKNRANRSSLRTALKKFSERLGSGQTGELNAELPALYATIDKAVQKKVISRNAAARQKSLLTRHLNRALAAK